MDAEFCAQLGLASEQVEATHPSLPMTGEFSRA